MSKYSLKVFSLEFTEMYQNIINQKMFYITLKQVQPFCENLYMGLSGLLLLIIKISFAAGILVFSLQ